MPQSRGCRNAVLGPPTHAGTRPHTKPVSIFAAMAFACCGIGVAVFQVFEQWSPLQRVFGGICSDLAAMIRVGWTGEWSLSCCPSAHPAPASLPTLPPLQLERFTQPSGGVGERRATTTALRFIPCCALGVHGGVGLTALLKPALLTTLIVSIL